MAESGNGIIVNDEIDKHIRELYSIIPYNPSIEHDIKADDGIDTEKLKSALERMKTFQGWRVPYLRSYDMAQAGFYYTKNADIVCCVFCGVEICGWVEGDEPFKEHVIWGYACPFLRGHNVGNIPLICEIDPVYGTTITLLEQLSTKPINPPFKPSKKNYSSRLESYTEWPPSIPVDPIRLSEAGFYYTGYSDKTICYYCAAGLRNWKSGDDPWVEHARYFNKCYHVILNKGVEFIEQCNDESIGKKSSKATTASNENSIVTIYKNVGNDPIAIIDNESISDESTTTDNNHSMKCILCLCDERSILFLPCRHLIACTNCTISLLESNKHCPTCRVKIESHVRVFVS